MKTATLFAALASVAFAAASQAVIVGTTGVALQIGNPPIANFPPLTGTNAFCWNEQQNVLVSAGAFADLTVNPGNSGSPTPGLVVGIFDSHFIHWADFSGVNGTGTISFSGNIEAVMFNDIPLDLSDPTFGAIGTTYPTGQALRGLNAQSFLSISGNTLAFNFMPFPGAIEIEQVRVLTRPVPAPGAAALACLGGLMLYRRRRA
ncbi:hypothetical protein PHYC_01107 [Phycisphaerales bacterium]|nr:hypothetical protein PHYC_01107 [Phycisphaerales bacterium]